VNYALKMLILVYCEKLVSSFDWAFERIGVSFAFLTTV
jgi:hypothetical protein